MSLIRVLFLGLALAAAPALAQQPALLVLGDSLAAGYGLPQGRGWVDLLQKRLVEEKLDYRVVNASISGETTLGGRNRLDALLRQHRPRAVIIELGANDGLRGQPVDTMRENLTAMVRAARTAGARVLLVGMQIPPNYGQEYTRKFREAFTQVARTERVPLVPFLLDGFADKRELFQQDGIHPNEQAQPLMVRTIWPKLAPLLEAARQAAAGLQGLAHGRIPGVLTLPAVHDAHPSERTAAAPRPGDRSTTAPV
jgi:acyl-CoA thioesterase-1